MKLKGKLIITLLSILLIPAVAFALNFDVGEEVFSSSTINDDYYAAGGTVLMKSDVNGDMIIAGGRITVDSKVSQDLALAGGEITVLGEVGDDARLAGGNVKVSTTVKDDLIIFGGNIELGDKGFVGGDLIFGGGNVNINGKVNGSVEGGGGNVYINNVIGGNVKLWNVDNVEIGPNGKIMGDFSYRSGKQSESVNNMTVNGSIDYTSTDKVITEKGISSFTAMLLAGFSVFRLLILLFTGLFFIWIFRYYMSNTVETGYKNPLKSLGLGFLLFIAGPLAALISLATGIGVSLAFIIMLMWFLALAVGKLAAVMMIGMKIVPVKEKSGFLRAYASFAIGALIFVVITFIPMVGWVIKFILCAMGLGALVLYEMKLFNLLRKEKKV